jgi:glycerol-3-phosphate acyltransferase PlsX
MLHIAVDAMGGDRAPTEIVHGAVDASRRGVEVTLVGDAPQLNALLRAAGASLPVVHAAEVIEMADDPASAIREKKDSSVSVAARLVADGEAGGLVSAGSTGAALAAAAFNIGRLPGVSRPAIASLLPNEKMLLDAGANLSCRPEHLVQFAIMGSALAQIHYRVDPPRVGLINIGEEAGKGRPLDKEAYELLSELGGINFIGNVDGRDFARDTADVFVTDGFTGNVVLKTAEGASQMVLGLLQRTLASEELEKAVQKLGPALEGLHTSFDADSVGGAHLLGTRGVVVVAHGSSSRRAIANAIDLAAEGVRDDLVAKIQAGVAGLRTVAG